MMDQEILDSELMEIAMNSYKVQFGDTGHITYAPNNTNSKENGNNKDNVFNNAYLQGVQSNENTNAPPTPEPKDEKTD